MEYTTFADVVTLFFDLHLISGEKYDICQRDDLFYFAFPRSAALGFKIFFNAALRAKSLLNPVTGKRKEASVNDKIVPAKKVKKASSRLYLE